MFGHAASLDCIVQKLSAMGASIQIGGKHTIPDTFTLKLSSSAMTYFCRVVWRGGEEIGVIFT